MLLMKRMNERGIQCCVIRPVRLLLLTAVILLAISPVYAQVPLKVYYVRHAENGHNVIKEWKHKPQDQWPDYVGKNDVFTPKGEKQVATLTEELKGLSFDLIAVSPSWRTRNTILPYLRASGKKGEIWPELAETSGVNARWTAASAENVAPNPTLFSGGDKITLPDNEQPYFIFREDGKHVLEKNDKYRAVQNANSMAMAQKAVDMLKARFSKSGKSVLLVGHGNSGSTLLRMLTTSKTIEPDILNIGIWMAEEQADGSFKLKTLNGKPYVEP